MTGEARSEATNTGGEEFKPRWLPSCVAANAFVTAALLAIGNLWFAAAVFAAVAVAVLVPAVVHGRKARRAAGREAEWPRRLR